MIDGDSRALEMRNPELFAQLERYVLHNMAVLIPELIEFRINDIIEDVGFKQFDHFRRRVYAHGLAQLAKQIVYEDRQAGDVIHMRVGDDDVTHGPLLRVGKRNANTAGIDRHPIVDDEAGKALRGTGAALRVERTW